MVVVVVIEYCAIDEMKVIVMIVVAVEACITCTIQHIDSNDGIL